MAFFRDIAMPLLERGFKVMPLRPKSKQAFLPDWPALAARACRRQIEEWDREYPDANVGVVAGHRHVILDDDNGTLKEIFEAETGNAFPKTFTVKTAKGFHYYFLATEASILAGNMKKAGEFDLQADTKYVVGPNSIHPSGVKYEIVERGAAVEMPDDLLKWLQARADGGGRQAATKSGGEYPRAHAEFDFDKFCEHYGFEFVNDGPKYFFAACPAKGEPHTTEGKPDFTACALYYDGETLWFEDLATSCPLSEKTLGEMLAWLHENGHERYDGPIWEEEELDPAMVEEDSASSSAEGAQVGEGEQSPSVRAERQRAAGVIAGIIATPAKESPARLKQMNVAKVVFISLKKTGRFYNVDNRAVYFDEETRKAVAVAPDNPEFHLLMEEYGIAPGGADKNYLVVPANHINAHVTAMKRTIIYPGSYYDADKHALYLNEWHGHMLRIDSKGKVERLRNGDDDVLMKDGVDVQAQTLAADVESIMAAWDPDDETAQPVLWMGPGSLIKSEILDTILYDESKGVTKEQAQIILMTCIVGLFFYERIPAYPWVFFFGSGGSMKTSMAVKMGRLMMGPKFMPTPAATEADELKILAINNSFIVLDEANTLKKLNNIMKSLATGAQDVRRELYTTVGQRTSAYQGRFWLTANEMNSGTETVNSRMILIDVAARTEKNPYRSEHYVNREFAEKRDRVWTELVGRLAAAMRALGHMDSMGRGDVSVSHRMSAFFVFGGVLAEREGLAEKFGEAMEAMAQRQVSATTESLDIVALIRRLPRNFNNKPMTWDEIALVLPTVVPPDNVELKRNCSQGWWVKKHLTNNPKTLADAVGMMIGKKLRNKNSINTYTFTGCEGAPLVGVEEATMPDIDAGEFVEEVPKAEPHLCECKGCKGCNHKSGHGKPCERRTKATACSACRARRLDAFVDKEPAPTEDAPVQEQAPAAGAAGELLEVRPINLATPTSAPDQRVQRLRQFNFEDEADLA